MYIYVYKMYDFIFIKNRTFSMFDFQSFSVIHFPAE